MQAGRFLMVLMPALVSGCAGPFTLERTISNDPAVLVRLESSFTDENSQLEPAPRPATFTEGELSALLQSVTIRREVSFFSYYVLRQDPTAERAFTEGNVALLARPLASALAKAHPQEMITFLVSRGREDGLSEITSGGLFLRGDLLYVLLTNVRVPVTTARKMERLRDAPLTPLREGAFSFVPGPHQSLLQTAEPLSPLPHTRSLPALAITYKALLATSSASRQQAPDSRGSSNDQTAAIEEKLQTLKTWRERGLITDQDYQRKRQELLDRF